MSNRSTSVTVMELACYLLDRAPEESLNGNDFDLCDLPLMGGCAGCHATVAAYNSCPTTAGYLYCIECVGPEIGFATVQEAAEALWPGGHPAGLPRS